MEHLEELAASLEEIAYPDLLAEYDREELRNLADIHQTPLLIMNLENVDRQYHALKNALPGVELYYAIKSLAHPALIARLNLLGCNFDLATSGEVNLVRNIGVSPERCIHTHPIKKDLEIRSALAYGNTRFVVDNMEEVEKFAPYKDKVELMVRVSFRSLDAQVDLSRKFGCALEELPYLIDRAQELGITISGLSFHVGSQSISPVMHVQAIDALLFAMKEIDDVDWKWLDIGGGFPVPYNGPVLDIDDYCAPIRKALSNAPEGLRIFAEPGRFISGPSMIELVSVMGKSVRQGRTWYYMDDGVYGAFSGQMYDHTYYPMVPLNEDKPGEEYYPSVLAGPTCDSVDMVNEHIDLPDMKVGDLMVARVMGAYTVASASEFNYFPIPKVIVVDRLRKGPKAKTAAKA